MKDIEKSDTKHNKTTGERERLSHRTEDRGEYDDFTWNARLVMDGGTAVSNVLVQSLSALQRRSGKTTA